MSDFQRHITVASGYLELGLLDDAANELEGIEFDLKTLPEVIGLRVEIFRAARRWDAMAMMATQMVRMLPADPKPWLALAFATRRADSLQAARSVLLEAEQRHPEVPVIKFNLACYDCQLGDLASAKLRLSEALQRDKSLRLAALEDADLEPLWAALGEAF
jgi:tetratricopeptide (TPR) repeat protein